MKLRREKKNHLKSIYLHKYLKHSRITLGTVLKTWCYYPTKNLLRAWLCNNLHRHAERNKTEKARGSESEREREYKAKYILIRDEKEVQLPVQNNFIALFQFLLQFMRMQGWRRLRQCWWRWRGSANILRSSGTKTILNIRCAVHNTVISLEFRL